MCTSGQRITVGTSEHGRSRSLVRMICKGKLIRMDALWRGVANVRFSTVCVHKMLLKVCRPTDSRVKYQVNKLEQRSKADPIKGSHTKVKM